MKFEMILQVASAAQDIPTEAQFQAWVLAALVSNYEQVDICVRIVDETESHYLNHRYRYKDKPTNVLSFPYHEPGDKHLEADIVICAPVVIEEALQQHKSVLAHYAHLTVHACLHAQGFDHHADESAEVMEEREISILKSLGFDNPYLHTHTSVES